MQAALPVMEDRLRLKNGESGADGSGLILNLSRENRSDSRNTSSRPQAKRYLLIDRRRVGGERAATSSPRARLQAKEKQMLSSRFALFTLCCPTADCGF